MRTDRLLASLLLAPLLLAAGLLAGVAAPPAWADTIRLRSGESLEVDAVEVLEDRVRVTMQREGQAVRVEFKFEKFTPRTVLKLFDRGNEADDARACLGGARLALRVGLPKEARRRFRKAAKLDPALVPEVDQGLQEVRFAEATQAFKRLEERLRKGKDPAVVHEALEALLVGPHAMFLTVAQIRRIEVLSKLAQRLAERAAAKKAAADKKKKPKKPPAKPPKKPGAPDRPPPPRDTEASPYAPGSYADKRWRERHPGRRGPAAGDLPGRQRPPLQGGGGGASRGGRSSGGGARSGGQGSGPPSGGRSGGGSTGGGSSGSGGGQGGVLGK